MDTQDPEEHDVKKKKKTKKSLEIKTGVKAGGKGGDDDWILANLGGSDELKKMAGL